MITLQDLGIAYRKAKVDLYYSTNAPLFNIADYEKNLHENLSSLLEKIGQKSESWVQENNFLGTWTAIPKSLNFDPGSNTEIGKSLIFSSPKQEWEALSHCSKANIPTAEFRIMAKCSLDFHVLSALWILKVGHLFDKELSNSACGNRLRRTKKGDFNQLALGSFQPYLVPFKKWRDTGINTMRQALESDKSIIAITADINSFYHELNPSFMLNPDFIEQVVGIRLTPEQGKLNRLFINALLAWAQLTPLKKGLPVGLPASSLIANMALIELDKIIEKEIAPLYYGRYVDDIILVIENKTSASSTEEVWEWLLKRCGPTLTGDTLQDSEAQAISFCPDYLNKHKKESRIQFSNSKNKVFILEGSSGIALINSISHQTRERASEWRSMPQLPLTTRNVRAEILATTQSNGEIADNLRKTDALTMRRASFALKLRDFEAYERDLEPSSWINLRYAFFDAFIEHVLVLPKFFELYTYLPRVIRLATASEDFDSVKKIFNNLKEICHFLRRDCRISIKKGIVADNAFAILDRWEIQIIATAYENMIAAFPTKLSDRGKLLWQEHLEGYEPYKGIDETKHWLFHLEEVQNAQVILFSFDLAHVPFRFIGLPKEMVSQQGIPKRKLLYRNTNNLTVPLESNISEGICILSEWMGYTNTIPNGLLFATRPFSLPELFIVGSEVVNKTSKEEYQHNMNSISLALRGIKVKTSMPYLKKKGMLKIDEEQNHYNSHSLPRQQKFTKTIAVSSWKTDYDSWVASVMKKTDPDSRRYARLCRLINDVITQPRGSDYLILPELSLPAHWFMRIAQKLQGVGVSLITGIEYLHKKKKVVRNQVWMALSHHSYGFSSFMVYRQDKQAPALKEGRDLHQYNNLILRPNKIWKKPPIIQHGNFRFALLICSELTNIKYRADLRGKIDALFVPEWNQDTESFNALVESAALDIHAYIIQCNDRQYGDSRIRAPFKENWHRDILRVKGGITDYCVIGEIDIKALRKFQSYYSSPEIPFKPVPDGFNEDMAFKRRTLPISGDS